MYVKFVEIENYKSFWQPQTIHLEPGFNLFVGANNSGKTTVLEALDLNAANSIPHRSVANLPEYGASPSPQSRFKVSLATNLPEYRGISTTNLQIPLPKDILNKLSSNGNDAARQVYKEISGSPAMVIAFDLKGGIERVFYETHYGCSECVSPNAPNDPICALSIEWH